MLYSTIVTLLIASIGNSRIQAKEIEERRAQLNKTQTSVDGVNSVIEALTVQENNTFNTDLNDKSVYGSIVKVENNIYKSPNSRQPINTQTHIVIAPGGPGHNGVSYVKSEERDQQGQLKNKLSSRTYMSGNTFDLAPGSKHFFGSYIEQKNNVRRSTDGNNQTQPNEQHISSNGGNIGLNAGTILTNNLFQSNGNMTIFAGSYIYKNRNVYTSDKNSQTGEKTMNNTERQDNSSALIIKIWEAIQAEHKKEADRENEFYFGKQNPTEGKTNSSYTIHDSYPSSQTETNAQDNKEKEAYAEKHSEPNGQTRLSSNVFYSFTYFLIILIKSSVLN